MRKLNIKRMKSIKISSIKRGEGNSIVKEKKYTSLEISRYRRIEKELDILLK